MYQLWVSLVITILVFLLSASTIFAKSSILINEFLIDPTPQNVEVINTSTASADLSGWIIDDNGGSSGTFTIPANTLIAPNSCLVFTGDFSLNKSTEDTARLFDKNNTLIDSFTYKSSPGSGISYARKVDGGDTWASASASLGKFNSTGQSCIVQAAPTPTPTLVIATPSATLIPTTTIQPTPTPVSYDNIYLSEVMAYPDNSNEWVEIYNNNDYEVNLKNWYLDDKANSGSTPKIFSLTLAAKSYGVIDLSSSMFNNDGDQVRLLDFNSVQKDSFEYSDAIKAKSLGKTTITDDTVCTQEPSKGSSNNSCLESPTPTPTTKTTTTTSSSKSVKPSSTPSVKNSTSSSPRKYNQVVDENPVETDQLASDNNEESPNSDVLGYQTSSQPNWIIALVRSLAVISFGFSLLTIISISMRIKKKLGSDDILHKAYE